MSHPVGVAPTMRVPDDLPLDHGTVTCLTCHLDGGPEGHSRASRTHDGMLRRASAPALCVSCHTGRQHSAKAMHAAYSGRAHLRRRGSAERRMLNAESSLLRTPNLALSTSIALDDESRTCLSCHDGTTATDIGLGSDGGPITHASGHPVGVAYRSIGGLASSSIVAPTGSGGTLLGYGQLVPVSTLDPRIRLFDGNIGCGSCHSPYSQEHGLLVMDNYRSRLCLSCHQDR